MVSSIEPNEGRIFVILIDEMSVNDKGQNTMVWIRPTSEACSLLDSQIIISTPRYRIDSNLEDSSVTCGYVQILLDTNSTLSHLRTNNAWSNDAIQVGLQILRTNRFLSDDKTVLFQTEHGYLLVGNTSGDSRSHPNTNFHFVHPDSSLRPTTQARPNIANTDPNSNPCTVPKSSEI